MTASGKLDLKGLDEYIELLVQAGKDVDKSIAKALEIGGDILLEGMQEHVPVGEDPDPHPGNLKAHLRRTLPVLDGNTTYVEIGVFDGENLPDADLARYANAQEYGYTRGGKHYKAQSYIRTGTDTKRSKAQAAMKQSLIDDGIL